MKISVERLLILLGLATSAMSIERKFTTSHLNLKKRLPPNPPVTHQVYITFKYYSTILEREVEQDVIAQLYATVCPKTVENFIQLARSVKIQIQGDDPANVKTIGYAGTDILSLIKNNMVLLGDVIPQIGPFSIYGPKWADENFFLHHDRPGRISMSNFGPNTQSSKFLIDLGLEGNPERDNVNVVFGQIGDGLEKLIDDLQYIETNDDGKPVKASIIEYTTVEDQKHGSLEQDHVKYIKNLQEFKDGNKNAGTTLAEIFSTKINSLKVGSTTTSKGSSSIIGDVCDNTCYWGFAAVAILYLFVAKFKSLPPFRSSKVVSMRKD